MGKSKLYLLSIGALVTLSVVAGSIFAASPEGSGGSDIKPAKPPKQAGSGTVTAISGSTITIQGKKGSVTVDASKAKVITISAPAGAKPVVTKINLSDIKVGDTLRIQGSINGNSVTATQIVDVTLGGGAGNSAPFGLGNQPPKGPDGNNGDGGLGQLINPAKCMDDCKEVGSSCIAKVENGLKKKCDQDGIDCRAKCDDLQYNDATKTRACYSTQCRPAEVACYNQVVAEESTCTTNKDVCVMNCQKASKPSKPGKNLPPEGKVPGVPPQGGAGQRPPMSEAAEKAIANNDFEGWVKAMTAEGPMPAPLKVITKDNFPKFAEAHGYQVQAQELNQKARDILQSLGINEGPAFGGEGEQGGQNGLPPPFQDFQN